MVTDDEAVPVPKCLWLSAAEELADIRMRGSYPEFVLLYLYFLEIDANRRNLIRR